MKPVNKKTPFFLSIEEELEYHMNRKTIISKEVTSEEDIAVLCPLDCGKTIKGKTKKQWKANFSTHLILSLQHKLPSDKAKELAESVLD
jgi:hypothetical protein